MAALDSTGTEFAGRTSLSIVFSTPQVAHIGATLSDLEDSDLETASFDISGQARAYARTSCGVLRIYATCDTGQPLGAEICTPAAEHLADLLSLAVEGGRHAGDAVIPSHSRGRAAQRFA